MGDKDSFEVRSVYQEDERLPDLIFSGKMEGGDETFIYSFYEDEEEDLPDYMETHLRKIEEAEEVDEDVKESRLTLDHLHPESDVDWNVME